MNRILPSLFFLFLAVPLWSGEISIVSLTAEEPGLADWKTSRWGGISTYQAAKCPLFVTVEGGSPSDQEAVQVAWDGDTKADGEKSLRIDASKLSSDDVTIRLWMPVPPPPLPNTNYLLKMSVRCQSGGIKLDVPGLVGWADGKPVGVVGGALKVDSRWKTFENVLTSPAFTRPTGPMYVVLALPAKTHDTLWLDDLNLSVSTVTAAGQSKVGTVSTTSIPQKLMYAPLSNPLRKRVEEGLEKAKKYLVGLQTSEGSFPEYPEKLSQDLQTLKGYTRGGQTAMVALALHEVADRNDKELHERISKAADWLAAQKNIESTYGVSWRVIALSGIDPDKYKDTIKKDCDQLAKSFRNGELDTKTKKALFGWGYFQDPSKSEGLRTDNSNGQFALLALRDATLATRLELPKSHWQNMEKYWVTSQLSDGGWNYSVEDRWQSSYNNMVAAGLASAYICFDMDYGRGGSYTDFSAARPLIKAIDKGQTWLNSNFLETERMNRIPVGTKVHDYGGKEFTIEAGFHHFFYYAYGCFRVGQASGLRKFGEHDWFDKLANMLLNAQRHREESEKGKGEFSPELYDTAFAVLFLARGKAPIIMHKLDLAGDPCQLARDVPNFTLWMSRQLERPLNWQRVNLSMTTSELLQAPVLFISALKLKLTQPEKDKLRAFVLEGGTILANNAGGSFNKDFENLLLEILPEFSLVPAPADHPILSCYKKVPPGGLKMITNGLRPLVVYASKDLGAAWHKYEANTKADAFHTGANVVLYSVDLTGFRDKLSVVDLTDPPMALAKVKVGRAEHDGGYNAVPNLLTHLSRQLQLYYKLGIEANEAVKLTEPIPSDLVQLWITGSTAINFTPAMVKNIKDYVEKGGTVVLEAAGGSPAFNQSVEKLLKEAFANNPPVQLTKDHPVINGKFKTGQGFDVVKGFVTRSVNLGGSPIMEPPQIWGIEYNDRVVVFWSKLDLSSGMAGHQFLGNKGYKTETARGLAANMLLSALDAAGEKK